MQISNMDFDTLNRDGFIITSQYVQKQQYPADIPKFVWPNPDSEPAKINKEAYVPFIEKCFKQSYIKCQSDTVKEFIECYFR